MIRVGCSGWSYEHWRGRLYPEKGSTARWLERYAEVFDTVEVNASFYRLPTRAAAERWASATPEGFCFAVKASRYLTQVRRLRDLPDGSGGSRSASSRSGRPTSSAPPSGSFRRPSAATKRLASALASLPPGRHAFEFRHPSWFVDATYDRLRVHRAALVVADRAPAEPTPWIETASWTYLRFHRGRRRNGGYSRAQLEAWAERIASTRGDVYAYFNNDWEGLAVDDALSLLSLLERRAEPPHRAVA
jgi:uncharacterized protein YecE (DUF72 family)